MASDDDLAAQAILCLAEHWADEMTTCRRARAHGGCAVTDLLGNVARSIDRIRAELAAEQWAA